MDPYADAPPQWAILVEEAKARNNAWHISAVIPAGPDLPRARAAARDLALRHTPSNGRARDREVYQAGDDTWLVAYRAGAFIGTAHFRVTLVQKIA